VVVVVIDYAAMVTEEKEKGREESHISSCMTSLLGSFTEVSKRVVTVKDALTPP
jgi:hypothetical protein